MVSVNTQNSGTYIGRLTREPVFFRYDGGQVVILTVACKRNYRSGKEKTYESDYIEFRSFSDESGGIYKYLHTGDKVGIQYRLQSSSYEKNGKRQFSFSPMVTQIDVLEGKQVREERRIARTTANKAAAQ